MEPNNNALLTHVRRSLLSVCFKLRHRPKLHRTFLRLKKLFAAATSFFDNSPDDGQFLLDVGSGGVIQFGAS